jgi:hypothetical protein
MPPSYASLGHYRDFAYAEVGCDLLVYAHLKPPPFRPGGGFLDPRAVELQPGGVFP